jgi:hypothetical protein
MQSIPSVAGREKLPVHELFAVTSLAGSQRDGVDHAGHDIAHPGSPLLKI